jgi:DNA-binding PadR family transcriptional regulator
MKDVENFLIPRSDDIFDDLMRMLPLTPAVFFVLLSLANGEKHGYAIMQDVASLSAETVRMGPGTLYSTIQRLADLALIQETEGSREPTDHESRRRYYRLTDDGKRLLQAEVDRMESVVRLARKRELSLKGKG